MPTPKLRAYYRACTSLLQAAAHAAYSRLPVLQIKMARTLVAVAIVSLVLPLSPFVREITPIAIDGWRDGRAVSIGYSSGEDSAEAEIAPHFYYMTSRKIEDCIPLGIPPEIAQMVGGCGGISRMVDLQWLDLLLIVAPFSFLLAGRLVNAIIAAREAYAGRYHHLTAAEHVLTADLVRLILQHFFGALVSWSDFRSWLSKIGF